jgi:hypothetical protein
MKATRGNKRYTEAELISVLQDAPTGYNIMKHARVLGRSEDAIKIIYRVAAGEQVRGTGWEKVHDVAKRLGWMGLAAGKG